MTVFGKILASILIVWVVCNLPRGYANEQSKLPSGTLIAAGEAFTKGDPRQVEAIPSSFGPYRAKSNGIGVYKGQIKVSSDDLKEHLYIVIRPQTDKNHSFGWIRAFVNNQLVATEGSIRDNRIVEEVTRQLQGGDVRLVIMGVATPGTCVDFYVVPKDNVMKIVQCRSLGFAAEGPFVTVGGKQENFTGSFKFPKAEMKGDKTIIGLRTQEDKVKRFAWLRVYLNGTVLGSEKDFNDAEANIDITDKLTDGQNKIDVTTAASTGASVEWIVTQLPKFNSEVVRSTAPPPVLNKLNPSSEANAGDVLEIQGSNLNAQPSNNRVYFGNVSAPAKSLRNNWLSVDIPKDVMSGVCNVSVAVGAARSNALALQVNGYPRVHGTSLSQCSPGTELEIQGENFPARPDQVRVTVGNMSARVLKSSKQSIRISVPELAFGSSYPIKVSVGRLSSPDEVSINIDNTGSGSGGEVQ